MCRAKRTGSCFRAVILSSIVSSLGSPLLGVGLGIVFRVLALG